METVDEDDSALLLKSIRISPVDQAVAFIVGTKALEDFVAVTLDVVPQPCRVILEVIGLVPAIAISFGTVVGVLEVTHSTRDDDDLAVVDVVNSLGYDCVDVCWADNLEVWSPCRTLTPLRVVAVVSILLVAATCSLHLLSDVLRIPHLVHLDA